MMRTLYENCSMKRKTWRTFENGDHNSTVAEPGYFDAIWDFLVQEVLSEREAEKGVGDADIEVKGEGPAVDMQKLAKEKMEI